MKITLAGIIRKKEYSPNHELNDYLILIKTKNCLEENGAVVKLYYEHELENNPIKEDFIFSMALGLQSIKILQSYKEDGKIIINSPESVISCYRRNMTELLQQYGIPFPKSILVHAQQVNGKIDLFYSDKIWIKQADLHLVNYGDVISKNDDEITIENKLDKFLNLNSGKIILQEHIEGDSIKFYAVRGTDFFHYYKSENNFDIPIDYKLLRELTENTASVLDLHIYGGDAIVSPDGSIKVVDMNNWPSFAPVRKQAAKYIADLLLQKVKVLFIVIPAIFLS